VRANLANRPSIERVREVLAYEPETGVLRWKITLGSRAVKGREAGNIDSSTGYHRTRVDGFFILSHHIGWAITHGVWPVQLDHVRGKEAGNALDNLRLATQHDNMGNIRKSKHNTSGLKGVSWHEVTGKWAAQIRVRGKQLWLGSYDTKEEAHEVYMGAARKHFGEFARSG
jgi:hypothetical protein